VLHMQHSQREYGQGGTGRPQSPAAGIALAEKSFALKEQNVTDTVQEQLPLHAGGRGSGPAPCFA
jgi:hypothetical protein